MRPQRKRTLSKVLIEAQEAEAVRAAPAPKRVAIGSGGDYHASTGRPPLYPITKPLNHHDEITPAHPPDHSGFAQEEWRSLCQILTESARHEKGSGERSLCLEKLYADLRRIYRTRAATEAAEEQHAEAAHHGEEEKVEELKVEDLVKIDEAEAWGSSGEEGEAPVTPGVADTEAVHSPAPEPLSNAETPTHMSPKRRNEKLAEAPVEDAPIITRTRSRCHR
jgi:hypothetical protein